MTNPTISNPKHVTLTMTIEQMDAIVRSVDFMARLYAGDFYELAHHCRMMPMSRKPTMPMSYKPPGNSGRIDELCRELKCIVRPDLPINASCHKEKPASTLHDIRADILNGYYSQTDEPKPGVYPYFRFGDGEKIKVKVEE